MALQCYPGNETPAGSDGYVTQKADSYRLLIVVATATLAVLVSAASSGSTDRTAAADDLLVVDCLLPGQIRKLGTRTTYVSPRRPVKTTALDCGIRGGEYVAYDRANAETALKVWLPMARQGDIEAAVYVGEIFEKGIGGTPDYKTAAHWYQIAAEAGDLRAQINLGHLYESGLGVPRDPAKAVDWYRRASGLPNIQLNDASVDPASSRRDTERAEAETLRRELERVRTESDKLREELDTTREELERARSSPKAATQPEQVKEPDPNELAQDLEETRRAKRTAEADALAMRQTLAEREAEIADLVELLGETRVALEHARTELDNKAATLAQSDAALAQLAEQQRQLERMSADLVSRENALSAQRAEALQLRSRIDRLENQTRQSEARAQAELSDAAQQRLLAGPEISVVEPPLQVSRGVAVVAAAEVALVSADIHKRTVIGRVTAPAGLLSVTVNDRAVEPNDLGVFTTQVPLTDERTPVLIAAVDHQGKREELVFELVRSRPVNAPELSTYEQPVIPKLKFGKYHALVIGNNNYAHLPDLNTAITDAQALHEVLRDRYGFESTLLTDANRYEILSALNNLRERLTSDDNLLIYYAGHGTLDEVNMRGQWLPVDAEPGNTANWLSNVAITDILNVVAAKHILVIADSCYSGSLTRSSIGKLTTGMTEDERLNWLRTMLDKRARMVFTSGGLQPVLDSGGGEHSVFSKALLEALNANQEVIEGQRLYQQVAARVAYAASSVQFEQVPEYAPLRFAGHETGDFFFVPGGG